MRKTWALVVAAAMAAASLTACSSSKPAETAAPETEAVETEETEAEAEATGDQQEILVAAAASLQYTALWKTRFSRHLKKRIRTSS